MTKEEYANFKKMSDAQLLDFVTETQGSQRGHLARYIIGSRPHDTMKRAAVWAAIAAIASATGAFVQVCLTLWTYLHPPTH